MLGRSLLSIDDLDFADIDNIFNTANVLKPVVRREMYTDVLKGAVLGNLFFESSTRTRISFGAAFERLGGSVCDTTGFTFSSINKGESIQDTSRVISGYSDIIVLRHPDHRAMYDFYSSSKVPLINGGSGPEEHPTQALLDLYTIITEFEKKGKSIDGSNLLIFGDLKYGRTVHSLVKLLVKFKKIKFIFISPEQLSLPSKLISLIRENGHSFSERTNFSSNFESVDLIYATRLQKERIQEDDIGLESYPLDLKISKGLIDDKFNDVIILHPLPRDSSPNAIDLSSDLDCYDNLAIFRQTDNGMLIRMALFSQILGVDKELSNSFRRVKWSSRNIKHS